MNDVVYPSFPSNNTRLALERQRRRKGVCCCVGKNIFNHPHLLSGTCRYTLARSLRCLTLRAALDRERYYQLPYKTFIEKLIVSIAKAFMPTQSIIHITSRCGGGKSFHTITQLHKHLLKTRSDDQEPGFFILASKTNSLSQQNYKQFASECAQHQSKVPHKLIDSNNTSTNVVNVISNHIRQHREGVLFMSHAAVSLIEPSILTGTTLIFDEVPDNLVKEVRLFYEVKDQGQNWEKFISYQPQSNNEPQKVALASNVDHNEVVRYISNIQTKKDNAATSNVAEMLKFLLDNHEDMYFMTKVRSNITYNYYTGIDWRRLDELRRYTNSIVILSAELKRTLLGFVAQHIAGLDIQEQSITENLTLQTTHQKRAIIYPILSDRTWSTYLKGKPAEEVLVDKNLNIISADTVLDHARRIVTTQLGGMDYLLITNKRDRNIEPKEGDNIRVISSSSHGSNSYSNYHHAAYLSSNRPDPIEINTLTWFASKYNQIPADLIDCVITERCYESAYQCLARTSVRNADYSFEGPHIFFVPDMKYAEYVASWFEQGYATIDTSLSCTEQTSKTKQIKTDQDIELLTRILTEKKTHKTPIKVLIKQAGISIATYGRLKKKHKTLMQELGLMK